MIPYILIKTTGFNRNLLTQNISLLIFNFWYLAVIARFYLSINQIYIIQDTDCNTDIYLFRSKDVFAISFLIFRYSENMDK